MEISDSDSDGDGDTVCVSVAFASLFVMQMLAKMFKEDPVLFLMLVLFLLMGGVLTLITLQNLNALTYLNLYFWKTPEFPVGILLIGAILLGAVLIYLFAFLAAMRERRELQRLRWRIIDLEAQLQRNTLAMNTTPPIWQPPTPQMSPSGPLLKMPGMTGPLSTPPRQ